MGPLEGNRMADSTCVDNLEPLGRVAVLAGVPEVRLAGWLVALGAVVGELPAASVAA
jgi:hypothetical protein